MRERVGAVIIENGFLLTEKREKSNQTYWVLPGGGVEGGENNEQALIRECKEELGADVVVGELLFEFDFTQGKNGSQKEFFYVCEIAGGELGTGDGPEFQPESDYEGTREIQWLEISRLDNFDLRPIEIKRLLN